MSGRDRADNDSIPIPVSCVRFELKEDWVHWGGLGCDFQSPMSYLHAWYCTPVCKYLTSTGIRTTIHEYYRNAAASVVPSTQTLTVWAVHLLIDEDKLIGPGALSKQTGSKLRARHSCPQVCATDGTLGLLQGIREGDGPVHWAREMEVGNEYGHRDGFERGLGAAVAMGPAAQNL